jgi:hypothetical protein
MLRQGSGSLRCGTSYFEMHHINPLASVLASFAESQCGVYGSQPPPLVSPTDLSQHDTWSHIDIPTVTSTVCVSVG